MKNTFEHIAVPGVREIHPYTPGKPIEEVERELGLTEIVKLASNESPLGPSPLALDVWRRSLETLARYPDGTAYYLRHALSKHLDVDEASLTIGNGSNDVLDLVVRAFVSPGQEVIYPQYSFLVFELAPQSVGAKRVVVPAKAWGGDLEAMAKAITERTRLIFLANPNNPTGTWVPAADLEAFIAALPLNVLMVVDEAYVEYVELPGYTTSLGWLAKYPNLIVTRTFSKAYGLAGLRVGFSISHPDLADYMNRVRHPFNVNSLALAGAEVALEDRQHLARSVEVNRLGMAQMTHALENMGIPFIPSAGNFITIDTETDAMPVFQALLRLGVIVRPLPNYALPNHLRITIGTESENTRAIDALEQVLVSD